MQQNVIIAVSFPIMGRDSVKFVQEIKNDKGAVTIVSVNTADQAQLFGGEVGAVTEFLNYHVKPTMENTWKFNSVDTTKIKAEVPA
jgi:hypothetical protein